MPSSSVLIRVERAEDLPRIREVNRQAFGQDAEGRLIDELRAGGHLAQDGSLVAVLNDQVVGHLLLSKIAIRDPKTRDVNPALALAPMAVLPAVQREGIGTALIREALSRAAGLGGGQVVLLGHPDYYPRFGFLPAGPLGLTNSWGSNTPAFMVLSLRPDLSIVAGEVVYSAPFLRL